MHGITVTLYKQTAGDADALNRTTYTESAVNVNNVLVGQPSSEEVLDTLNLTGRRAVYTLGIPKGDTNDWTDKVVEFFGHKFRTIGMPTEGIEDMIPLQWNKKIQCEAINE